MFTQILVGVDEHLAYTQWAIEEIKPKAAE